MKLKELIIEKAIVPSLKGTKRDDCISELLDALAKTGAFKPTLKAEFLKAVVKREKKGSTGFGHGVAIPHVKTSEVSRCVATVGLHAAGIDFNALDRQPVHAVFLLLSPEDQPEAHIDAMESLFALNEERYRKFLKQARSVSDVVTLLEEADATPPAR